MHSRYSWENMTVCIITGVLCMCMCAHVFGSFLLLAHNFHEVTHQ